ncbi:MAG: glycosyltransferase family 9 protein [Candidatus Kryptoniota bacterium]
MRILVSRLKFIGDIVLTTPVLEVLREKFSHAYIAYLGDSEGTKLLEHNPNLNEIIPYRFNSFSVREQIRIVNVLRKKGFDIAIDLFGNPRSAVAIFFSGARIRIGGNFGWRGRLYTHPIRINARLNAVQFHLRYLEPLGISENYRRPRIYLRDDEINEARSLIEKMGIARNSPVVGFHIGGTWPAKVWQPESFAELARYVASETGNKVIVTYGPADLNYLTEFKNAVKVPVAVIEPRPLRELAAIIAGCDLFVSNDAAPMHISAAVGTRTIGIFGPGEEDIWFPYSEKDGNFAIRKDVPCHPCHLNFCNLKGDNYMRCMNLLKPHDVFERIRSYLNTK